jgi:hypothetical protein
MIGELLDDRDLARLKVWVRVIDGSGRGHGQPSAELRRTGWVIDGTVDPTGELLTGSGHRESWDPVDH